MLLRNKSTIQPERQATWPAVNQVLRAEIIRRSGGLAEFWEISPIRIEDNALHTDEIIERLFPADALLCCGHSANEFETRRLNAWLGELAGLQFIVPSPVRARTKERVPPIGGSRRFLVVQFDEGTVDEQAALLINLAGYAPLVCGVHSGNNSMAGWFFVHGQPEDRVLKFFRYSISLGANPATWAPAHFVWMPDGQSENRKRQTVYFLNFRPLEAQA
ncbi:MAG: hypothetical protein FJ398_15145 [Verrucomicrobia bacterium]|nr:hypothetical protein [Verrucomicrobiota bacterium]